MQGEPPAVVFRCQIPTIPFCLLWTFPSLRVSLGAEASSESPGTPEHLAPHLLGSSVWSLSARLPSVAAGASLSFVLSLVWSSEWLASEAGLCPFASALQPCTERHLFCVTAFTQALQPRRQQDCASASWMRTWRCSHLGPHPDCMTTRTGASHHSCPLQR